MVTIVKNEDNPFTYEDFIVYVSKGGGYSERNTKDMRFGQILFNALSEVRPDIAERIRGTIFDPFFKEAATMNPDTFIKIEE
jgi:hypothetical protein